MVDQIGSSGKTQVVWTLGTTQEMKCREPIHPHRAWTFRVILCQINYWAWGLHNKKWLILHQGKNIIYIPLKNNYYKKIYWSFTILTDSFSLQLLDITSNTENSRNFNAHVNRKEIRLRSQSINNVALLFLLALKFWADKHLMLLEYYGITTEGHIHCIIILK